MVYIAAPVLHGVNRYIYPMLLKELSMVIPNKVGTTRQYIAMNFFHLQFMILNITQL